MTSDRPDPGSISDVVRALMAEAHPSADPGRVEVATAAALKRVADLREDGGGLRWADPNAWVREDVRDEPVEDFSRPGHPAGALSVLPVRRGRLIAGRLLAVLGAVSLVAASLASFHPIWLTGVVGVVPLLLGWSLRRANALEVRATTAAHLSAVDQMARPENEWWTFDFDYLRSASEATLFALMTVRPHHFRRSVEESFTWAADGVHCVTRVRQRIPYVWFERIRRDGEIGHAADGLAFPVPLGRSLPSSVAPRSDTVTLLSNDESAHAVAVVVRRLVSLALHGEPPQEFEDVLGKTARWVAARELRNLMWIRDAILQLSPRGTADLLQLAADFVIAAARDGVVVAVGSAAAGRGQEFEYRYRFPPSAAFQSRWSRLWVAFGVPPDTFRYRSWLAFTASQYAFKLRWYKGSFVRRQWAELYQPDDHLPALAFATPPGSVEARLEVSRAAVPAAGAATETSVTFARRPTALTTLAPFVSLVTAALVWLTGHTYADLPLLFAGLAGAGAVAAYVLAVRSHLGGGGLRALAGSFLLAFAAVFLAYLGPPGRHAADFFGVSGVGSALVLVIATVNVVAAARWWVSELNGYATISRQCRADLELS